MLLLELCRFASGTKHTKHDACKVSTSGARLEQTQMRTKKLVCYLYASN
jgi:hypothetical protein